MIVPSLCVKAQNNTIVFSDGTITFRTVDTQASTGIRWKTVGFSITRVPCLYGETSNGGYPSKYKHATIYLKENWCTESDYGSYVKMTFSIPRNVVSNALVKAGLSELKSNDTIYLHGIFQVMHNGMQYGNKIYDLPSIINAEQWTNPKDFEDRFDVKVIYKAPSEPVVVQYKTAGGDIIETKTLSKKNWVQPGATVCVSLDDEKIYKEKTYRLYKSYIRYHTIQLPIQGTGVNVLKGDSFSMVKNRTISQRVGGVDIVGIMKKIKQPYSETKTEIEVKQNEPEPYGEIEADPRGDPAYHVVEGIPVTEKLYVNIYTQKYLVNYKYQKISGKKDYVITITKPYKLKWNVSKIKNGKIQIEEKQLNTEVKKQVTVERTYSYWQLEKMEYYILKDAVIYNDVLPNKPIVLLPYQYQPPEVLFYTYSKDEHLKEPKYQKTIQLPSQIIQGTNSCPSIPEQNFKSDAEDEVKDIKVRNDMFMLGDCIISSGELKENETEIPNKISEDIPAIGKDVFYRNDMKIPVSLANGVYKTKGEVEYIKKASFQSSASAVVSYNTENLSDVVIHTPTVCQPSIHDARKYCQMERPDFSRYALVLDQTFIIDFPSVGDHLYIKGYGYRDYGKYILKKQVKFPFDTYANQDLIPSGNWYTLTEGKMQFYIPIWVKEKNYDIQCRAVASNVNYPSGIMMEENTANLCRNNYVAVQTLHVQISGRIYGMNLFDITDYPAWQQVFRQENSLKRTHTAYYSGICNQNGKEKGIKAKNTFPLIPGSHPYNPALGILPTGYASRFEITTIGEMYDQDDYIQLTPSFYWIDENGNNRKPVDIYYTETIQQQQNILVKVGSKVDLQNIKKFCLGDPYFAVEKSELYEKAILEQKDFFAVYHDLGNMFTFHHILLSDRFRTYIGKKHSHLPIPNNINKTYVAKSVQKWYGEYYLPSHLYVVEKDFRLLDYIKKNGNVTFHESFFQKTGYIIVHFNIQTIRNNSVYLNYENSLMEKNGYCNMWKMEKFQTHKKDYFQRNFSFQEGDYLLYDLEKSAAIDYRVIGTH